VTAPVPADGDRAGDEPDAHLAALRGARCVVTGGLGFIGSNLVHALHGAGARVAVVDALVARHGGHRRNLEGLPTVDAGDGRPAQDGAIAVAVAELDDVAMVEPVVDGADVVFNLAGQVSHLDSMTDPVRDLDLNARTHLGFLELVRRVCPGARIVHTSTRQVYGRPRYLPIDEAHPTDPIDVNGIAKLAGEQLHLLYGRVHGLPVSVLRLTNVYGPRQRLLGDAQGFLPIFVRRALQAEPITVYGEGDQLRDCLHVDDVVAALVASAVVPDVVGEVCNLGHPAPETLGRIARIVVDAVADAGGPRGEVVSVPWPAERAKIDVGSTTCDSSKAKRLLDWEPSIDLATGLPRTVAFYREHGWYLSST
jgi:UDP-glucose 4-epimerase